MPSRFIILIMIAMIFPACSSPEKDVPPPDHVVLQLKWIHQAQFAGFYVAEEKGYYRNENIAVQFLEGGAGIDSASALIANKAQFAVLSPEDVLIKRSENYPLTAIGVIYRRSAVVFVSYADSGIARPSDFKGKTIATLGTGGAVRDFELQFKAMMKHLDIDMATLSLVPYDPEYKGFTDGSVDVASSYLTGGVICLEKKGRALNLIWPGDYGVNFYSDTIVTTREMIEQKPDLVLRFLRATLNGWQDAVGDPENAVNITMKYAEAKDLSLQTAMMDAMLPLVNTGEDKVGWMKADEWHGMNNLLLNQNIIPATLPGGGDYYTMTFLNKIYGTR